MPKTTLTKYHTRADLGIDPDNFWSRVDRGEPDECWLWTGAPRPDGYGSVVIRQRGSTTAHRAAFIIHNGAIKPGLVVDHLCRNRQCVNPNHLDAVTSRTNSLRSPLVFKEACSKGHPFAEFAYYSMGKRYCHICHNERAKNNQRRYRRAKGAIPFAERTHCGRGHELTPDNIKNNPRRPNERQCKTCTNERARARYAARVG